MQSVQYVPLVLTTENCICAASQEWHEAVAHSLWVDRIAEWGFSLCALATLVLRLHSQQLNWNFRHYTRACISALWGCTKNVGKKKCLMPWPVYIGTAGKSCGKGPEVGGHLTYHRPDVHFDFCTVFKSCKNVTLLVQWIKMRWVRGSSACTDMKGTLKHAQRQYTEGIQQRAAQEGMVC